MLSKMGQRKTHCMSSSICGIRVKTKFLVETEQIGRWPEAVGEVDEETKDAKLPGTRHTSFGNCCTEW